MKDTLIYQIQQLLLYNKINFDKKELAFQIQSHPSYPSLYATTSVLSHFDIDHLAMTIPVDLDTLKKLPKSFLAQINTNAEQEFVVVTKNDTHCTILTTDKKKKKHSYKEFLDKFTGIIVVVEKDELLENTTTKSNFNKALLVFSSILFISFLTISAASNSSFIYLILCAVSIFISNAIVQQEQGNQTSLGNAFCSSATEKKDCDAVLSSNGALLFNRFKLSNISFLYFIGLTLASLLLILQGSNINTLYVISLSILPITAYSIYYQAVKIKKWCFLCLGIVGVIWAQAVVALVNLKLISLSSFSVEAILLTTLGFLVSFLLWNQLNPKFKSLKELRQTKIDYFRFKRNFNLFKTLLEKSKPIDTNINNTSEIILGNKNAPLNITVITNPFCGHCRPVHTLIENVLKKYNKEVSICIRFNVNTNDIENDAVKITSTLLEIYDTEETHTCLNAMGQIYSGMSVNNWLTKWGNCSEKENYINILKQESAWCKNNSINFTPEILINGHSFPKEYERTDLIYFIEELYDDSIKTNIENTNNKFELIA